MNTQPQRADWWREVTDPDEVIQEGRWYRIEFELEVTEHWSAYDRPRSDWYKGRRVFVDSRWAPPEPSVKVGATVTTKEQLDALPNLSVILSMDGQAWQLDIFDGIRTWYATFLERGFPSGSAASRFGPFTILWLPETEDDQ